MSTIVLRNTKGSALTFTEMDNNFSNLNSDKLEALLSDTTPQLGGNLDVNGNAIISASNGNIAITPDGTGKIVLDGLSWPTADGTANYVLKTDGAGNLAWADADTLVSDSNTTYSISAETAVGGANLRLTDSLSTVDDVTLQAGSNVTITRTDASTITIAATDTGITDVVSDTTPQLGGNLDVNGNSIVSASGGNIAITPDTTGSIVLDGVNWPQADGSADQVLKTNGAGQLSWTTISAGGLGNVVEDTTPQLGGNLDVQTYSITTSTTNGDISIVPDGTGAVVLQADVGIGYGTATAYLTSISSQDLVLLTDAGTNSGSISITAGANGAITVAPNGTGKSVVSNINYFETPYTGGSTTGTITPDVANGNVQIITLTGNITFSAFSNAVTGQSMTLVVKQPSSGGPYTLTSTMKFANAEKTLSTAADAIDIISVFYDGTNYYASLAKGFA